MLQKEAMEIVEEQHHGLEEARLNLTTPLTSEAETSQAENYGRERSKTTSRAKPMPLNKYLGIVQFGNQ